MPAPSVSRGRPPIFSSRKNASLGHITLAGIVFLYALFAALWIFFSDRALEFFADPETITRLATVKGFAFVAVTSSLLYLLLDGWRVSPLETDDGEAPKTWRRVLLMIALIAVVPAIGLLVIRVHEPQTEREAYVNLQAIARLKAEQIENWLGERRSDSLTLANSQGFVAQIVRLQASDPEAKAHVRAQLEVMQKSYSYASIIVFDAQGWPLLTVGEQPPFAASAGSLLPAALRSGEVGRSELLLDRDGQVYIDFVVPLLLSEADGRRPVGSVVLRVHPERFLFPLIQTWPTASPSAETLLARRDGESVLFINELRHRKNTALSLTRPLATPDLPAAVALRSGLPGTTAGKDYRGVEVLAAYRPVAGTDWMLIAKVDRDEVLVPLWQLVWWVCAVAFAALVSICVALLSRWRQQARVQRLRFIVQKEAALRDSELRYRAVTESSSDAIVSADTAGNIVSWNPAAERLFGYDKDEVVGQPLTLLMPERFRAGHDAGMRRLVDGAPAKIIGSTVELAGRHKSGSEFPLELSLAQWARDNERFFIGTMRDITERKASAAKLQRLNRIYAALSQCNQSIVRCDNESALFEQICRDAVDFGGAKMAWIGMVDPLVLTLTPVCSCGEGAADYLSDIHISIDESSPFGHGPAGRAVREDHPVWTRDFMSDPSTRPWHELARRFAWGAFAALPLHRGGEVIGVFCLYAGEIDAFDEAIRNLLVEMAMDISFALDNFDAQEKRLQAEAHTRRLLAENETILRNALVGIVYLKAGRVVSCNRRFEELFGYAPGEPRGRSAGIFFASHEHFLAAGERAYGTLHEGSSYSEELIFRRRDGSLFEGALTGCAIDPASPLDGSIWICADISERVRLEEEMHNHQVHLEALVQQRTLDLEQALATAKLADVTKDAFLANVSHELRTPLNAVIGMAELARRLSHDPVQQAYLDKVGNAGKTLAHLIDDLLDLSKIVAGHMAFESTTFSLRGMVERSYSVMAYKAAEKGLRLSDRIADDVPDTLVGDPLRIEQVLLNLVSNAIKFTAAGRIEIRIGVFAREAERICLALEVEDSGVGLSEDEIAQLFKPFTQADASMTRKYGGTGLGLAICKYLAEMMGGQISVSSQPGLGSTFRVTLWLGLGKMTDVPAPEVPGLEKTQAGYRDTLVLVVEDQALNREIVEALLRLVGITPHLVNDGQQALDLLAASGPDAFDLVLMDVQMPIMDGLTATRELRSRAGFEKLPIIAMTAHTMEHEREISANAGMNDHIGKPFDSASFYRTLAKWLPAAKRQISDELPASGGADPVPSAAARFPSLRGIDTAAGIARFAGNETRYRHWLSSFIEEGPAAVRQIRHALAASGGEEARQIAHAFKGRVGMLGMTELHAVVSALEAALRQELAVTAGRVGPSGVAHEDLLDKTALAVDQACARIRDALGVPGKTAVPALPAMPLPDTMPAPVAILLGMLQASDGGSAAAIARCLETMQGSDWAPHLQQAMEHAQRFDFFAAANALSAATLAPDVMAFASDEKSGS